MGLKSILNDIDGKRNFCKKNIEAYPGSILDRWGTGRTSAFCTFQKYSNFPDHLFPVSFGKYCSHYYYYSTSRLSQMAHYYCIEDFFSRPICLCFPSCQSLNHLLRLRLRSSRIQVSQRNFTLLLSCLINKL